MVAVIAIGLGGILFIGVIGIGLWANFGKQKKWTFALIIALALAVGVGGAIFFAGTQAGQAMIKSTKSNISGMERTVRVYTANGDLIAEYEGQFNILDDNGGIMFEVDGKRHIYWNCFVESIEK